VDARYFGEILSLPSYSPENVKHKLTQQVQYQDGNEVVELTDSSANWSDSTQRGSAIADGLTTNQVRSNQENRSTARTETEAEKTLRKTVSEARAAVTGSGTADGSGTSHVVTTNSSQTLTQGGGRTIKQTLVPTLKWRDVVSSVQFFTPEEHVLKAASELAGLPTGTGIVYVSGQGVARVTFPFPGEPLARTPRYAAKVLARFYQELWKRPEFATPREILAERERFLTELLRRWNARSRDETTLGEQGQAYLALAAPTEHPAVRVLAATNDPENTPLEI
jgi:hypothetical protein